MSKKFYETVAVVKEIEVHESKCTIKFHPVKKYSVDQYFLCLKMKASKNNKRPEMKKRLFSGEGTYKLLEEISVTLDCEQQKFDLLKIAAERALPVHIRFKKEPKNPGKFELCKVYVEF